MPEREWTRNKPTVAGDYVYRHKPGAVGQLVRIHVDDVGAYRRRYPVDAPGSGLVKERHLRDGYWLLLREIET